MSVSAFEHPLLSGLVGDDETREVFSVESELDAMLSFEVALARAEAEAGVIPPPSAHVIAETLRAFKPDMSQLRTGTGRDGIVVAELVKQIRQALERHAPASDAAEHVHFGATSQDVIDTALVLRLKRACAIFDQRLAAIEAAFAELDEQFGAGRPMGHTRMQAAIEIKVSDRIRAWSEPLARHRERLQAVSSASLKVQFGGAAGTLDKLDDKGAIVRQALARELRLADAPQWQSQRDSLVELGGWLALLTGSLGKFGQDIALLAEMGGELEIAGGGGSSAMAHKQNPVAAEVLVALSRYNAVQVSGLQQAMVHEQERSGAAWTLEWLILPSMVMATGAALRLAAELVSNIRRLGKA